MYLKRFKLLLLISFCCKISLANSSDISEGNSEMIILKFLVYTLVAVLIISACIIIFGNKEEERKTNIKIKNSKPNLTINEKKKILVLEKQIKDLNDEYNSLEKEYKLLVEKNRSLEIEKKDLLDKLSRINNNSHTPQILQTYISNVNKEFTKEKSSKLELSYEDYTVSDEKLIKAGPEHIVYYKVWRENEKLRFSFVNNDRTMKAINNRDFFIEPFCEKMENSTPPNQANRIETIEPGYLNSDYSISKKAKIIYKI